MEALGIIVRILPDHQTFGQIAAAVDHDIGQAGAPADIGARQDDGAVELAIGVDPDLGRQQ